MESPGIPGDEEAENAFDKLVAEWAARLGRTPEEVIQIIREEFIRDLYGSPFALN